MANVEVIRLDGSYGEGGGQILRTALALSAVTGRPLELFDIRKGRKNPGLGNQHLTCVKALAQIAQAQVGGDRFGSTTLRFAPRRLCAGEFLYDVAEERGSAGSVTLILQALLPSLCMAPEPSRLIVRGGTHVPFSPPVHYVQAVLLPMLEQLGLHVCVDLIKAGWYPKGGGEIRVAVNPTPHLTPQAWKVRGTVGRITGWSVVSNLPLSIAKRQQHAALEVLQRKRLDARIDCVEVLSSGTGTCVVLVAECERSRAGFSALGERGRPAEQVGQEAAQELLAFLETDAALDEHLADQVVVFLALASGRSQFTTAKVTPHLLTNLWAIQQCLSIQVRLDGQEGEPGLVTIEPTP